MHYIRVMKIPSRPKAMMFLVFYHVEGVIDSDYALRYMATEYCMTYDY